MCVTVAVHGQQQDGSAALRSGALSPSSAAATTNSMEVLDDRRKLAVGDRVSYRVVEERKPPVDLGVFDSGEVEVPLIGRVPATGKTCKQLAYEIKRPLEKEYFYKATVIVSLDAASAKSHGRIYISGYVRSQGPMELPGDETLTLSKAIIRAGGVSQFGNASKVKVTRKKADGKGESETLVIDVDAIIYKGRGEKDIELRPDDSIVVPRKMINL
jgi:protein involved in polysaccharide export with SLBB domain